MVTHTHVLYLLPGHPLCQPLEAVAPRYPQILLRDVRAVRPSPPWLTGVPTLVSLADRLIVTGSAVFDALLAPLGLARPPLGLGHRPLEGPLATPPPPALRPVAVAPVAPVEPTPLAAPSLGAPLAAAEDERYVDAPEPRERVTQGTLEEAIRRREQLPSRAPPPTAPLGQTLQLPRRAEDEVDAVDKPRRVASVASAPVGGE